MNHRFVRHPKGGKKGNRKGQTIAVRAGARNHPAADKKESRRHPA
jgi:hypothetical protein